MEVRRRGGNRGKGRGAGLAGRLPHEPAERM